MQFSKRRQACLSDTVSGPSGDVQILLGRHGPTAGRQRGNLSHRVCGAVGAVDLVARLVVAEIGKSGDDALAGVILA